MGMTPTAAFAACPQVREPTCSASSSPPPMSGPMSSGKFFERGDVGMVEALADLEADELLREQVVVLLRSSAQLA